MMAYSIYEIQMCVLAGKTESLKKQWINEEIRKIYSIDDEIAILRQQNEKPEEYAEWNAKVEEIKARVAEAIHDATEELDTDDEDGSGMG